MQMRYPQPKNEDAFEELCLILLREHWSLPTLNRYGHRGERQHGVDLLDTGGRSPLIAVQCKHHDPKKTLPPRELAAEVEKAKTFPETIGEFYVLTTAKKSVLTQRALHATNKTHLRDGLFVVHLLTWDDVERIISNCPSAQDFLNVASPEATRKLLRNELRSHYDLYGHDNENLHQADLDEAKARLNAGEIQLAELLLTRIRNKSWDRLSSRHRYRWCTLMADVELRRGNSNKAAPLLFEARGYQPDDDRALANEIFAWELAGDSARASELANAAVQTHPQSVALYAAALRCAQTASAFSALMVNLPSPLRDHPDICLAAATRYDLQPSLVAAESVARRAIVVAAENPQAWFALGCSLLLSELRKLDPEQAPVDGPVDKSRLKEAHDCFTRVAELAAGSGMPAFQAAALVRRATAKRALGQSEGALRDVSDARTLAPSDCSVLLAAAQAEEERGNHDVAIQLLREIVMRQPDNESRCCLAVALWDRNKGTDRAEAVELASSIAQQGSEHLALANEIAVEGLIAQQRYEDAGDHMEIVGPRIELCLCLTLKARISASQGHVEEASTLLGSAAQNISSATARATLRKLAKLLGANGRLSDSLAVWKRLIVDGTANDDAYCFVECATRLGRDGDVLRFCATIRKAGIFDDLLLRWELPLLVQYDPETANGVLEELVQRDPQDKSARLRLVHLALRLGKRAQAASHLDHLPAVTEADPEEGAAVVGALIAFGRSQEALTFSYDLLRRHFQDHHAHRAFLSAMLNRAREDDVDAPQEAAPGIAVQLREDAEAPRWYVLEDSLVSALGVDNEIPANSPLARRLSAKKVGDQVALAEAPGLHRSAMVVALLPKHVFRFQDCGDRWQYRFPEQQGMWVVRTRAAESETPDFTRLFEFLNAQDQRWRDGSELYRDNVMPIHLLADALGRTDIQAMGHVAMADDLVLRCCAGSAEEYADSVGKFAAASEVVLDITALTTLFMLGEVDVLSLLGRKPVITHATLAALRAYVDDIRPHSASVGTMGADHDRKPVVYETTPERQRQQLEAAEEFLRIVESKCRVDGCPALADIDSADREFFLKALGASSTESIVHAAAAHRVLWTDDQVVAVVARERLGTTRVWTQGAFRWLNTNGFFSRERYAQASAKLLGWQYSFTSVNVDIMREAATKGEWTPHRWPFKEAISYLSLDGVNAQDAAVLSAHLVAHCYIDTVLPQTRHVVVQSVAEALSRRGDGEKALFLFASILGRVFGLNVAGYADTRETLVAWRREQLRRVVPT